VSRFAPDAKLKWRKKRGINIEERAKRYPGDPYENADAEVVS